MKILQDVDYIEFNPGAGFVYSVSLPVDVSVIKKTFTVQNYYDLLNELDEQLVKIAEDNLTSNDEFYAIIPKSTYCGYIEFAKHNLLDLRAFVTMGAVHLFAGRDATITVGWKP